MTESIKQTLQRYNISTDKSQLHVHLSYKELMNIETDSDLSKGYALGEYLKNGVVTVKTGKFTGRSPKDKYVVQRPSNTSDIWWKDEGSDNNPMTPETYTTLQEDFVFPYLKEQDLYVIDGFCGHDKDNAMLVRLITPIAWQAHFFKNMFIKATEDEVKGWQGHFWTIFSAPPVTCPDVLKYKLNSEVFVAFDLENMNSMIAGTWYAGEIKKGMFSVMNYLLPKKNVGSFHCSANQGKEGDVALFFGLSGTGKTTLSADSTRSLIGDDEHGWDAKGVFNLEGGCYAKLINLSEESEPEIYNAIRGVALTENVSLTKDRWIDFADTTITENTRVSYPLNYIPNYVTSGMGGHPYSVIFLTCDAYGVLPPVGLLSIDQAMYFLKLGYTAKVSGTEIGVTEPQATFSTCFAKPFLLLKPNEYIKIFKKQVEKHQTRVFLLNTGWTGGGFGVGHRFKISDTRAMVHAILDGSIDKAETYVDLLFKLKVPTSIKGISNHDIFTPKVTWHNSEAFDESATKLHQMFVDVAGDVPEI